MKRYQASLLSLSFLLLCVGITTPVVASSTNIFLNVGVCNVNGVCEDLIGETTLTCAQDCPPPVATSTPTTTPPTTSAPSGPSSSSNGQAPVFLKYVDTPSTKEVTSSSVLNSISNSGIIKTNKIVGTVTIAPYEDRAIINFSTAMPSLASLSWGKSGLYEIGSTADSQYRTKFSITLDNLFSNTRYYYGINLKDTSGKIIHLEGSFVTATSPDLTPPPPPTDFKFAYGTDHIVLKWTNPQDMGFDSVRLVRSPFFYPKTLLDGKVVYEGSGNYVTDSSVEDGKKYFYSLFAKDHAGNISDPAIIAITFKKNVEIMDPLFQKDPLLKNNEPYVFTSQISDTSNSHTNLTYNTFCTQSAALMGLSNTDTHPEISAYDGATIQFIQDNTLVHGSSSRFIINQHQLNIHVAATPFTKQGDTSMALCLRGDNIGDNEGYLFNYDAGRQIFNLDLPMLSTFSSYHFYIGMLEYKGEEKILSKGVFSFGTSTDSTDTRQSTRALQDASDFNNQMVIVIAGLVSLLYGFIVFRKKNK